MSRDDDDDDMEVETKEEKQQPKPASIFTRATKPKPPPPSSSSSSSSSAPVLAPAPAPLSSDSRPGDASLPWVEKYRPTALDQLISHHSIISTIQSLIAKNRLPHLLLYGPAGTGKVGPSSSAHSSVAGAALTSPCVVLCVGVQTSTILAIARQLYGPRYAAQILELNASDERGIDVVREQIKDFASSRQLFSTGYKLIVLDEADNMTKVTPTHRSHAYVVHACPKRFSDCAM